MKATLLYTREDGRSGFANCEIPSLDVTKADAPLANSVDVTHVQFVLLPSDMPVKRHTASRAQLLVCLSGICEFECAGGTRRMGPGDVVVAVDTTGEGHTTRPRAGDLYLAILPLSEEFDLQSFALIDGAHSTS
jgi:quercetin dioxygenase-like cupin family protein